jgi:hypothetical protein
MVNIIAPAKTNGEFIKVILNTVEAKIAGADRLLKDFESFRAWLQLSVNGESTETIIEVFLNWACGTLKPLKNWDALYRENLESIHNFFKKFERIALADFGIKVDMNRINDVINKI